MEQQTNFMGIGVEEVKPPYNPWDFQVVTRPVMRKTGKVIKLVGKKGKVYEVDEYEYTGEHETVELFKESDFLALEYQRIINDKRRGEIAMHFVDEFSDMVSSRISSFIGRHGNQPKGAYYKEEGWNIWRLLVCEALQKWTGKSSQYQFCNFWNYLFTYADKTVSSDLNDKVAYKDGKYSSTDKDDTGDSLNSIVDHKSGMDSYECGILQNHEGLEIKITDMDTMLDWEDARQSAKELVGIYDARNNCQWEMMGNGLKIANEQKEKEKTMTEEDRMRQVTGKVDRGTE